MALMGCTEESYKLLRGAQSPEEIRKIVSSLIDEQKQRAKMLHMIENWVMTQGAVPLFGVQEKYYVERSKQPVFFSWLSGKKPGDVTRGKRKKAK